MTGVNQPILAEVVPPRMRASAFALEYGLENTSSSIFGSFVVGLLAQYVFHYTPSTLPIEDTPLALRDHNAAALQKSLAWALLLPWLLCFLIYLFVNRHYPRDRDRANAAAELAAK